MKNLSNEQLKKWLVKENACQGAIDWLGDRDAKTAWEECPRGDWMLWCLHFKKVSKKLLVVVACQCARLSLKYVPKGELRPLNAIKAAEAWVRNPTAKDEKAAWAAAGAAWAAAWATAGAAAEAAIAAAISKECAKIVRKIIILEFKK